jgi:hypothetical protein
MHAVILLPALAAEHQRQKHAVPVAGHVLLPEQREVSYLFQLQRGVHRVPAAHELVQPESERREAGLGVRDLGVIARQEVRLDGLSAGHLVRSRCLGKERCGAPLAAQTPRLGSKEAGCALLQNKSKLPLDPARKRVVQEGCVSRKRLCRPFFHPLPEIIASLRAREVPHLRGARKRFSHHVLRLHRGAKELGRHARHLVPLLFRTAWTRKSRGGTHALKLRHAKGLAHASHEHCHVRALAPPIRVELVQDHEAQKFAVLHERALSGPGEDELEHDVVGKEDVRGAGQDALPLLLAFLSGIAIESDPGTAGGQPHFQELLQLPLLTVRQRVHGVDNDGPQAFP